MYKVPEAKKSFDLEVDIKNRFINLFFRAYFRCNDETCTYWIRNPVHDR